MKWKSPRCSQACWDEIKEHDTTLNKAITALVLVRRDRDEWKHQHENLLAMYQTAIASAAPTGVAPVAASPARCDCAVVCQDLGIQGGCRYIRPDRDRLRKLVDVVWNHCTESQEVPSTDTADQLINRVFPRQEGNIARPADAPAVALREGGLTQFFLRQLDGPMPATTEILAKELSKAVLTYFTVTALAASDREAEAAPGCSGCGKPVNPNSCSIAWQLYWHHDCYAQEVDRRKASSPALPAERAER